MAYYDGCVQVDLSTVKPMIALPFHPSNAYEIDELNANLGDILRETEKKAAEVAQGRAAYSLTDKIHDGKLQVQQGVIGGCAGGNYVNVVEAANLLRGRAIGSGEFTLNVYPSSMPVYMDLAKKGMLTDLMAAGAVVKTAFCGPCFGRGIPPTTMVCPSATPPGTSPTGKGPNRARARWLPWPSWMPGASPPLPPTMAG